MATRRPSSRVPIKELRASNHKAHAKKIVALKMTKQSSRVHRVKLITKGFKEIITMKWEKPAYVEERFGFEITMYVFQR